MKNASILRRIPGQRPAGSANVLLSMLFALGVGGCGPKEHANLVSAETFVEYYTVLLRAQEKAQEDPGGLRRLLAQEPLPEGWGERMIAFAEGKSLRAREWADLLAEAHARAEEPADD